MANDDEELFQDEMSGVTPLRREVRIIRPARSSPGDASSLNHRREAAVALPARDRNPLTDRDIEPLDPWYVLDFKRPGVQNGVYRKLRQGRYEAEARLDLHRMTVAVARRELYEFVAECHRLGLRSALIVHGKGERKPEQQRSAILKGYVNCWLREIEIVQAFHSAQPGHGGTGAAYLLLRKSAEKKRENRERFTKGRVPYERS